MERVEAEAIYDSGREACVEFIVELAARVEQHEERLRRLEEQPRQDSRTSSKPPSMDPPKTRAQRRAEARAKAKELLRREGEQRKAGGQSGHRGAGRELKPSDQMDEIVDHYPDTCGACGARFAAEQQRPGGRFGRHQVVELPPISVISSEHRTQQLRCRDCRARTSASLPAEIAGSPFGLRLQAALVTLTAAYRISRRGVGELARDLFAVTLSTGTADAICQRASEALAGPHLHLGDRRPPCSRSTARERRPWFASRSHRHAPPAPPAPARWTILSSSAEALRAFAYTSGHTTVMRNRKRWFEKLETYLVLWWVPAGHEPTIEEAKERLEHLKRRGPTPYAFTFRASFPAPNADPYASLIDDEIGCPA